MRKHKNKEEKIVLEKKQKKYLTKRLKCAIIQSKEENLEKRHVHQFNWKQ